MARRLRSTSILLFVAGVFAHALYRHSRYRNVLDAGLLLAWTAGAVVYFASR